MNITHKTILVTGASDGIGKSIALRLAKDQTSLILIGRDLSKLETVKQQCEAEGARVTTYAVDITDDIKRDAVLKEISEAHQIDVLVNNAGIWHNSTELADLPVATIESVIATNLTAHILITRAFITSMRSRDTAIVNIISSAGLQGRTGRTAYAASKFGMRGFTEALREETKSDPIRIGSVFQSGTNTQMFAKAGEEMPLEKYTDPNDLAEVVAFMLTRPPKIWINELHVVY